MSAPSQPDVLLQVALLEGCGASVRLSGLRQLGCYHQWTLDAAVARRGTEATTYAAVGVSDNSVCVYALECGGSQVGLSWYASRMLTACDAAGTVQRQ